MRSRYFWPITLILLGVLLLLGNLGLLPGSTWGWIWPLVLIWLGLSLLLGRRGSARFEAAEDSLPLDGATSARITLRHGAGRLTVGAGGDPALLFAGTFGGGVDKRVDRSGDLLDVVLQAAARDWTRWMGPLNWRGQSGGLNWALGLNPTIPLTLTVETGASEGGLDLSALRVTDLAIKTGASSTEVTLPAQAGQMRARIESGAASVRVSVPSGVAARIGGHMGVGALDVDQGRFPWRGDVYESDDFQTAANRVELEIKGGVGQISVR